MFYLYATYITLQKQIHIVKPCEPCAVLSKAGQVLTKEELKILQENCTEIKLSAGEQIIKEGLLSTHIAYLKTGLAKIHKKGIKGTDQILKIIQPDSYVGIQTELADKIHQYSASTLEESVICYIDIHTFRTLILRNSAFAHELILYLCKDELMYYNRFINVHQKQINGRLADTILFFADEVRKAHKFIIPLSRADIAALICTTRESVTRALKDLIEIGTISVNGKQFNILNYELLKTISEKG